MNVLFLDLETTGLSPKFCSILEVAAAVVDQDLQIVDTYQAVVFQEEKLIHAEMDDWCRRTHSASGLLQEVERSPLTLRDVDERLFEFIKKHFNILAKRAELAGNSVHFDLGFINYHMPRTAGLVSHQLHDVSGMARGLRTFEGMTIPFPPGEITHRAMPDVLSSLEQRRIIRDVLKGTGK